jgi:tRNA threonylcarbamoyl adenosine modification protein YeaZ
MILLIDTSSDELFIGLATPDATLLGFYHGKAEPNERGIHDARLAVATSRLFEKHEVHPASIKKIGIVIGPGSFTGLRIGLSFAKGIVSAMDSTIVPVVLHELYRDPTFPDNELIVLDSYKKEFAYVAPNFAPRDVRVISRNEIRGEILPIKNMSPTERLEKLLELTLSHQLEPNVAQLEPLYVTEFATSEAT